MKKSEVQKNLLGKMLVSDPVIVVTTVDSQGRPNGAAFGSYMRVAPLIMVAIAPGHDTYRNIKDTGEFVVNLPGKDRLDSITVFGKSYPEGVNEIEEAGLTALKSSMVKPPAIEEYKAHVECKFKWEKDVGSHMLVAGEMVAGSCDAGLMDENGHFDVVKAGIVHCVRYPEPVYVTPERYIEGKR